MEGSADGLHIAREVLSPGWQIGKPGMEKEEKAQMDTLETPQGPAAPIESGPGCKTCPVEGERLCSSCATKDLESTNLGAFDEALAISSPVLVMGSTELSETSPVESFHPPLPLQPRLSKVSLAEMDCLVCFNRYSPCRLPKVLACQHAFCAVCLKLLLRNEDHTWVIGCPLCRKATVVFGGLVCSLRNKEDVVAQLETPDLDVEAARSLDLPGRIRTQRQIALESEEPVSGGTSRGAAKRLVLLLLLVAILIGLVLPFLYTGVLKWALCSAAVLGLIVSVVLCCNPNWCCLDIALPSWRKKENPVASVA